MNKKLECHMPNNRKNTAVKKWLPVAHSPLDKSHGKKCDISRGLFAGSSGIYQTLPNKN